MRKKNMRIVLVLTIAALMALMTAGCGKQEVTPRQTADRFLDALQSQDQDVLKKVYAGGSVNLKESLQGQKDDAGADEIEDETIKLLMDKLRDFSYRTSDEKIDGDNATVKVKITTYSFGNAFRDFVTDYMSQGMSLAMSGASEEKLSKLANTLLQKHLKKLTKKDFEKTVTLSLKRKDGQWIVQKLDKDSAFVDAVCGGLITTFTQYANQLGQ